MPPVQEHINTLGIDSPIQRLTEYINEYERNSFPTQNVTIKLRQHKLTPAQRIPRQKKKPKNVPAPDSNPRPSAYSPAPAYILQWN